MDGEQSLRTDLQEDDDQDEDDHLGDRRGGAVLDERVQDSHREGRVGFAGAREGTELLGGELGVLVGAFALGIFANLYARGLDRPQQVVLVPAMILLVPGSLGFRGISSLLDRDTLTGIETTFAMFVVAMAIVAGLLIANAVVSPRRVM